MLTALSVLGKVLIRKIKMKRDTSHFFQKTVVQTLEVPSLVAAVLATTTRNSGFQLVSPATNVPYSLNGLFQAALRYINVPTFWWQQELSKNVQDSVRMVVSALTVPANAAHRTTENSAKTKVSLSSIIIISYRLSFIKRNLLHLSYHFLDRSHFRYRKVHLKAPRRKVEIIGCWKSVGAGKRKGNYHSIDSWYS